MTLNTSAIKRPVRFISTYWWLLKRSLHTHPFLFPMTVASGVIFRFSNIMSLVVSMRCAVWILDAERQAAKLGIGPGHHLLLGAALAILPLILAFVAVFFEHKHQKQLKMLRLSISRELALADVRGIMRKSSYSSKNRDSAIENSSSALERIENSFRKTSRSVGWFIQIVIAIVVLTLIVLVGLYIEFQIMFVTFIISIPLLCLFIWRRYTQSQMNFELQEQMNTHVRDAKSALEIRLAKRMLKPESAAGWKRDAGSYVALLDESARLSESFNANSEMVLNVGQGVIIFVFLVYLIAGDFGVDPTAVGSIVVSLILIRYAIAQLRIVALSVVQMSRDYQLLVRLAGRSA